MILYVKFGCIMFQLIKFNPILQSSELDIYLSKTDKTITLCLSCKRFFICKRKHPDAGID